MKVAIARLASPRAEAAATRSGLLETIGVELVYKSVHEALVAFGFSEPDYSSGGATGA
jgi:hypothetical protein